MIDMSQHKKLVHRSLLQREMIGGVPQSGLFILFMLGLIFIYLLEIYFTIIPIVLFYFVMRYFTSKDPWYIDILLANFSQKDIYLP